MKCGLKPSGHPDHPWALLPPERDPSLDIRSKYYGPGEHDYRFHYGTLTFDDGCIAVDDDGVPVNTGLLKTCIKCSKRLPGDYKFLDKTHCPGR